MDKLPYNFFLKTDIKKHIRLKSEEYVLQGKLIC